MAASHIPPGWDLPRVRDHSGDQAAEILDTDRLVTVEGSPEPLKAAAAFGFHDLAIVQLTGADEWYMGSLDHDTGAIHLWAATYDDFENALQGL
jgi:hypothetical protein